MKKIWKRAFLPLFLLCLITLTLAACECKHKDTEWDVDREATCAVAGTKKQICTKCGEVLATDFYQVGHMYEEGNCIYCRKAQYDSSYLIYNRITLDGIEGYEVAGRGNCSEYDLVIPSMHGSLPVLSVAEGAFMNEQRFTSVAFGVNIRRIGARAFYRCEALTAVSFADGSKLTSFGVEAFWGCKSLQSFTVPAGVQVLPGGLLSGCTALQTLTLPDGLTAMEDYALSECTSLTGTVYEGLRYLGTEQAPYMILYGVADKTATSFTVPNGVKFIASNALGGCTKLTGITLPEGIVSIGAYAFSGCGALAALTLPTSVKTVGEYAFAGCKAFTAVTLPEGLQQLGMGAFRDCLRLSSVTLPSTLRVLGASAFLGCPALQMNIYEGGKYLGNAANPHFVLVEAADRGATAIQLHQNTVVIANGALSGTAITAVVIPASVVTIGQGAFSGAAITAVTFAATEGWQIAAKYGEAATPRDVTSSAANAAAFLGDCKDFYWYK